MVGQTCGCDYGRIGNRQEVLPGRVDLEHAQSYLGTLLAFEPRLDRSLPSHVLCDLNHSIHLLRAKAHLDLKEQKQS